ncbi:hypothetical protein ACIRP3_01615 [Streptomyces sp. NPDC101209]|uniref:hypothetical protein n=1 Tax=Streptomyces sp. NPDC101209 TaxID=3366129 RepID=UPI0037FA8735
MKIVKPAGTTPVSLYGSSYPDGAEYPAGLGASTQAPLSTYAIPTGQAYVLTREAAVTDDYFPSGGAVVIVGKKMYTMQYNHRVDPSAHVGIRRPVTRAGGRRSVET